MIKTPWLLIALAASWNAAVHASPIYYQATDVADVTPGIDLWRYDYTVGNETPFDLFGFTIYFDFDLYDFNLVEDAPGSGDYIVNPADSTSVGPWETLVAPDANILGVEEDGFYDIYNPGGVIEPGAALLTGFSVTFIWNGGGTPGSQFFEYFGVDSTGQEIAGSSFTRLMGGPQPIPEPGTLALFVGGLMLLRKTTHQKEQ